MWNGPIECRLFKFDMIKGSARAKPNESPKDKLGSDSNSGQ